MHSGEYNFMLIHPNSLGASACYMIETYENGIDLGEAYYSGVMPE
jgi:hypothetical protein